MGTMQNSVVGFVRNGQLAHVRARFRHGAARFLHKKRLKRELLAADGSASERGEGGVQLVRFFETRHDRASGYLALES